jgi:molecular chaperone DnaK (HSP70)
MAIIGIDLGTSNSAAAVLRGGRPVIIPSVERVTLGGKAFPSYVALTADGQMLIGTPARRQAAVNPEGTASALNFSKAACFSTPKAPTGGEATEGHRGFSGACQ